MSPKVVFLFPDTNLFIQCLPLEQVDWSTWADFDEVQLIVTQPVRREIDQHKSKGNDRVASRARKASAMLREVIRSAERMKIIRTAGPRVTLRIDRTRPDESLSGSLDYGAPDEQLVGIVHAFLRNTGSDARVLTHDTGPMVAAQVVDVPFVPIPDEWLLPPESGEAEKRIKALAAEVERLRRNEPAFTLNCVDDAGRGLATLESEFLRYEPLNDDELSILMTRIKEGIPMATDFGRREAAERAPQALVSLATGIREVFRPATEAQISAYRDEHYPAWVKQCEEVLRNYHRALQEEAGPPQFRFVVSNDGTRPGRDVLFTIEALGRLMIRPPSQVDADDGDSERRSRHSRALPPPPDPPRGEWKPKYRDSFAELVRSSVLTHGFDSDLTAPLARIAARVAAKRDPNAFYWKPQRPIFPTSSFSLECEQWRHGVEPEEFDGEIYFEGREGLISGAIECRINAENLSDVPSLRIPVQIRVTPEAVFERADHLVSSFLKVSKSSAD